MCYCDYNPPAVYGSETRRARKDYRCSECRRTIAKGESHEVHTGLWDGHWDTFRWCAHCAAAWEVVRSISDCDCFLFGDLWQGILDEMTDWGSTRNMAVYRMVCGARRKWTRRRGDRKGTLAEIPKVAAMQERRREAGEVRA